MLFAGAEDVELADFSYLIKSRIEYIQLETRNRMVFRHCVTTFKGLSLSRLVNSVKASLINAQGKKSWSRCGTIVKGVGVPF